jgi:adenylate kinase family enzyme
MNSQAIIFIGRYAAGKGTQAELLIKRLREKNPAHEPLYMYIGSEFRKFNQSGTYSANLTKQIMETGGLLPEFLPIYMWVKLLLENYKGSEPIIFDGSPRKLLEAKVLETVFPFYGLGKPSVVYLDVEHEEAHNRLQIRAKTSGRKDDGPAEVENRRKAYEADVIPVIEYYRTNPNVNFLDIKGERSIEEVHADIVKSLGLS